MNELSTPLRRARGLGSARHGVRDFIGQRVSAVALLFLGSWALWSGYRLAGHDFDAVHAWLGSQIHAALLILFILIGFYHGQIGLRVIIEDYVGRPLIKTALLIANVFVAAVAATLAVVCILGVSFGGGTL